MTTEDFRKMIIKREGVPDEDQYLVDQCWEELSDAIVNNYEAARVFLLRDCTLDEALWVAEVYDDIIRKSRSQKFLQLLRDSIDRFDNEEEKRRMHKDLDISIQCFPLKTVTTNDFSRIIAKRKTVHSEDEYALDQCWEELTNAIVNDYEAARVFLLEDCTADESSFVSEIYDDIIEKTQSQKFIDLLRESIKRFPEEDKRYHMSECLDGAIRCSLERD